jgi:fimbrial protein FimY
LSQSISQPRKTDAPFILLVTEDHFLRTGFLNGQFPLSSCCDYATLDDALVAQTQWPSARLVVDIESRSTGLLEKLDQLRRHSLFPPFLTPWLLVRADNYDTRLFCKAAGPFHVLERQLNAAALQHSLLDARPPQGSDKDWFSAMNGRSCRNFPGARRYVRLPLCRIVPIAALSIVLAASW